MEHELENSWTLYVTRERKVQGFEKNQQEWEDRLAKIHTFQTAESFWGVHNNLRAPSEMTNERGDMYLFRGDILPEWEHSMNQGGGSLVLMIDNKEVDEIWLKLLLSLIGNVYEELTRHICGAELAIRKNRFKIAVWVANADVSIIRQLGTEIKKQVKAMSLDFRRHTIGDKVEFSIK